MGSVNPDDNRAVLVWRSIAERLRSSLFGVPALWLVAAVALSRLTVWIDDNVDADDLPLVFATTVENARALLGAIASGTIAAASIVFSLTLVAFQLASSAYSTRVQRTFLRDRFQQNMIGIVLATFFYTLLVLREVRVPSEGSGSQVVPSLSTTVATWLALAAVLALLASISHTARSMRVSGVSARIAAETRRTIARQFPAPGSPSPQRPAVQAPGVAPSPLGAPHRGPTGGPTVGSTAGPTDRATIGAAAESAGTSLGRSASRSREALEVTSPDCGWVQQIGIEAIAAGLDGEGEVELRVAVGTYVAEAGPLATVRPAPQNSDAVGRTIRRAIRLGPERTLQQDVAFGLTMLEDIALRALSPGVKDPNTARAIIPLLGDLLGSILSRRLPPASATVQGVVVRVERAPGYPDYLEAATGQIRRASADEPEVRLTLVRTLLGLGDSLERSDAAPPGALDAVIESLRRAEVDRESTDPALRVASGLLDSRHWYRRP